MLINSGEASGQLESMLKCAANNQDAEITRLIETTLTLFEPAIILVMGAMVLFIVLAILLPIFQLDQMTGLSLKIGDITATAVLQDFLQSTNYHSRHS